ncbi:cilia- and flagella-associated protein 43 isoform X2 [Phasianus colchicus]|uniref:cilia- and flagella-associated protein 43 isoform X2 n=1 Tax=Phasianus colchicus TaxID=9054 RepID=UPI00129DABDF|nr:cilia- and flagella-associated protein 43 isoform X2 [Phasianus colchicus]
MCVCNCSNTCFFLSWVQGFSNKNFGFINNQTVCYSCGNYILFLNIKTKKTTALQCQTGQVGAFAVNPNCGVLAFSDRKLNPVIYVYSFPELNKLSELKGNIQLDYSLLAFSFLGPYLASYSSFPDFVLSVWNWQENILLCSESQPGVAATSMSFNPMNWQQLCFVTESSVTIWHIERNHDEHYLIQNPVKLPDRQGSLDHHEDLFFPYSCVEEPYHGPVMPVSAIAGLVGDEAETFVPRTDIKPSLHPTAHCWTTTSDIYLGCKEGYILAIDTEKCSASIIQQKPLSEQIRKISDMLDYIRREVQKKKGGKPQALRRTVVFTMAFCNEGLYTAGIEGVLYFYHIRDLQYEMKMCTDISEPISTLIFSPDYTILLIITDQGTIYSYEPAHGGEAVKLLNAFSSYLLAADFLTLGDKYCVSVTISGGVQIWLLENGTCLSMLNLDIEATAMACCPSSNSVAVGTKGGQIYFIDVTKVEAPRVVHRSCLSKFPVLSLHYDQSGQFLIVRAMEGYIFVLDARPSKLFQVLGYVVLAGEVLSLSVVSDFKNNVVEVMVLLNVAEIQQTRLEIFCLSSTLMEGIDKYVNDQGMLNASAIKKEQYDLEYPLSSAVRLKDNIVYGYCTCAPFICKYNLSKQSILEDPPVFLPEKIIPSNQFGSGFICLSPNSRWLASAAKDGVLFIYDTSTMEILAQNYCHSYEGGGIRSIIFSLDGKFILVSGESDGALVCLKWKKIEEIEVKEADFHWQSLLTILNKSILDENAVLTCMAEWQIESKSTSESVPEEKSKKSPLEPSNAAVTEDGNFTSLHLDSTSEMTWLCRKTEKVIREETERFANQKKELQMRIKKLHKTIQKMMHENEQVPDIEKLGQQEFNLDVEEQERAQVEAEQEVARIREKIEMEILANCYLQDVIKHECWDSMCVKGRAVKCFHIACEVENYPLKKRDEEELRTLEKVLHLRKIEAANLKVQKKVLETKSETILFKEEENTEEVMADDTASCCLVGSLSSQYGADTSILYHQLDLHSREQKVNQIVLLKDIIYKVKTAFNKEFDLVAQQKEQEIARIKERNVKIREILQQLDLQVEVWEPGLTCDEKPEQVLTVKDSEIKAEKYLTPQEREKAEMLTRLEMERQLASLDSERQRALNDMMGGVLEVTQEDILKIDIPPPSFISKPEDEWNDQEKKIFSEYEEKVKELNEEKEKYRRTLKNELEELEASIQETTQNFDKTVCKLFEKKVNLEKVVYQEELKIVNLIYSLLLDEELDSRKAGLSHFLVKKQKEKVKIAKTVETTKKKIEFYTEQYDNAIAEDKNLEYGFRKKFVDVPANLLDELLELYKCRPRAAMTEIYLDAASRSRTCSVSAEDYKDALTHLMKAMDELDNPEHMPNGLDPSIWESFCLARRNKFKSEQLVKWMPLILAEMKVFLQRRIDDNEKMSSKIEKIFQELTWLQEEKIKFQLNLTFQFLLKQGQDQVEKKIASMVECKEFSKGIFQLEWEHKKMRMQIEDLNQKAQDIATLPITKDRQLFLNMLDYDSHIAHRIAVMEKTLGVMDKLHKKNMKKHQKRIKELEKCISLKEQANYELSLELKEMLVSVSERRHISQAADMQLISERTTKRRYQEILKKKHLRGLIEEQKKHLEILQAEAERLRSKTFPIL